MNNRWAWFLCAGLGMALMVFAPAGYSAVRDATSEQGMPSGEYSPHARVRLVQYTPPMPPESVGAGWLGMGVVDISTAKANQMKLPSVGGVLIEQVNPDSPAAKAGLKAGDVITQFGGQQVKGALEFQRLVRETPPGRTAQITYWRDGKSQTASAELARAPREFSLGGRFGMMQRFHGMQGMPRMPGMRNVPGQRMGRIMRPRAPRLGITAMDISGQLGNYFNVPGGHGVLVTEVPDDSPSAKGGVHAGDVITKINNKPVHDIAELRAQLIQSQGTKSVRLMVIRKGTETTLTVEPEQPRPPRPPNQTMGAGHA